MKAPVGNPDYSNAGANRDRRVPVAEPRGAVGDAVLAAETTDAALAAIGAAAEGHGHAASDITVDTDGWEGPMAEAGIRNLQDLLSWLAGWIAEQPER